MTHVTTYESFGPCDPHPALDRDGTERERAMIQRGFHQSVIVAKRDAVRKAFPSAETQIDSLGRDMWRLQILVSAPESEVRKVLNAVELVTVRT